MVSLWNTYPKFTGSLAAGVPVLALTGVGPEYGAGTQAAPDGESTHSPMVRPGRGQAPRPVRQKGI